MPPGRRTPAGLSIPKNLGSHLRALFCFFHGGRENPSDHRWAGRTRLRPRSTRAANTCTFSPAPITAENRLARNEFPGSAGAQIDLPGRASPQMNRRRCFPRPAMSLRPQIPSRMQRGRALPTPFGIDFEGIAQRILALNAPPSDYGNLSAGTPGTLFYTEPTTPGAAGSPMRLQRYQLRERSAAPLLEGIPFLHAVGRQKRNSCIRPRGASGGRWGHRARRPPGKGRRGPLSNVAQLENARRSAIWNGHKSSGRPGASSASFSTMPPCTGRTGRRSTKNTSRCCPMWLIVLTLGYLICPDRRRN